MRWGGGGEGCDDTSYDFQTTTNITRTYRGEVSAVVEEAQVSFVLPKGKREGYYLPSSSTPPGVLYITRIDRGKTPESSAQGCNG